MPDIQTEMQKILQAWDQPETPQQHQGPKLFEPTTNTSRATFEEVRDMPGLHPKDYIRRLDAKGHKPASTSSLLGQMVRQGALRKDSVGQLYPVGNEYKPLKAAKKLPKKVKVAKTFKVKTSTPAMPSQEALDAAEEAMGGIPMLVDRAPVYRSKVDTILDDISLNDAHALYRQLHRYFSGLDK